METEVLPVQGSGEHAGPLGSRPSLVVVGHGMVGHRLVEALAERGLTGTFDVTVLAEEPRRAYDWVNLSAWFDGRHEDELTLASATQYAEWGVEVLLGESASELDCARRTLRTNRGRELHYDKLVLATGSYPFVPSIAGKDLRGCFVYRTLDDLAAIRDASATAKSGVVIGGGLLGLEAAKALHSLGLLTHVIEFAPRLMPLQVDDVGAAVLRSRIEALGIVVHTSAKTQSILADDEGRVSAVRFEDEGELPADIVVFSAGIRARDELARHSGLALGDRGGIAIDESCRTTDPDVFAIGECAALANRTYGLVAPGYRMAEVVAAQLASDAGAFTGFDMSTKLKLLGVDVASFGDAFGVTAGSKVVSLFDGATGIYKKLVLSDDRKKVLGGILVGDASSYAELSSHAKSGTEITQRPEHLLVPKCTENPRP